MLSGFPPLGGPLRLLRRRPAAPARVRADAARARRSGWASGCSSDRRLARLALRRRDARRHAAGRRRAPASPRSTSTCSGTPSAGRARAAAPNGSPTRSSRYLAASAASSAPARASSASSAPAAASPASRPRTSTSPPRIVIADVMPSALRAHGRPARLVPDRAQALRRGAATVKVDWALDGPIPWANADVHGAGTVHVAGSEDEFLRSVKQAHDGPADRPFLLLGQQSVADPTRAPEGKHTAWAYTHGPQDGVDWTRRRHRRRAHRGAGRALRPRLPRPHPRPPRAAARRPRGPQREPGRRRRRRRQLPAAPGRLPPAPEALARTRRR